MRDLLAVALISMSGLAYAETWIVGTVGSYHVERKQYCEWNPGVGAEHGGDTFRFVVGTYHNSLCYNSNYAGVSWAPVKWGNWKLGTAFLGVTGYKVKLDRKGTFSDDPVFAPLPFVSYERRNWGLNLLIVPAYGEFSGMVGLQLKGRF